LCGKQLAWTRPEAIRQNPNGPKEPVRPLRHRLLIRDYEQTETSAEAWIYVAPFQERMRRRGSILRLGLPRTGARDSETTWN
jgi:hypothetical protein